MWKVFQLSISDIGGIQMHELHIFANAMLNHCGIKMGMEQLDSGG